MSLVVARRRRTDINVVPLIDVMVVLVFFLLISGRLEQSRTMAIVPPTASAGSEGTPATTLVVGVDRDALIPLEEQEAVFRTLRAAERHVRFEPLSSVFGHDAFLKEFTWQRQKYVPFLNE